MYEHETLEGIDWGYDKLHGWDELNDIFRYYAMHRDNELLMATWLML